MQKAVFFDRDGTINVDKDYLYKVEEFEFLSGIPEILAEYRKRGYLLILITNQSGVAKGYYTLEEMERLHVYMQQKLSFYGAQFDAIYYCPHHPQGRIAEYTLKCQCRKPGSLLYERAVKEYNINPQQSIAIGDKERDLIPAGKMGMKCVKIRTNQENIRSYLKEEGVL